MLAVTVNPNGSVTETSEETDLLRMHTNTFDLDALNRTIEEKTVKNYWALYRMEQSNVNMTTFRMKFSELQKTYRTPNETNIHMYSRRYAKYLKYSMIHYRTRNAYRYSDLYNVPVGMKTISENPKLFTWNFILTINGELITSAEVIPMGDHVCLAVDVASNADQDGIPWDDYVRYRDTDAEVCITFLPNYQIATCTLSMNWIASYGYKVPFDKFTNGNALQNDGMVFYGIHPNDGTVSMRTGNAVINTSSRTVNFASTSFNSTGYITITCIMIPHRHSTITRTSTDPYFRILTDMPCPIENMMCHTINSNGDIYTNDPNISIQLFYPNVYKLCGTAPGSTYEVQVYYEDFADSEGMEVYRNEVELYEKYRILLKDYSDGSIPEKISEYHPSDFVCNIPDFNATHVLSVPNVMNYKIESLQKAIMDNPWAMTDYMNNLKCPYDKFYIDIEKLDLQGRVRMNTDTEDLISDVDGRVFTESHYVFAMNRRFLHTERYTFRLFLDGLFMDERDFVLIPGVDFYYIYIPTRMVQSDSMLEVERYTLFKTSIEYTFKNASDYLDINFDQNASMCYAQDLCIYLADEKTYLTSTKYAVFIKSTLDGEYLKVNNMSCAKLGSHVRVALLSESLYGKKMVVMINRDGYMKSFPKITTPPDPDIQYFSLTTPNNNNNNKRSFRLFNNGRLLIREQWYFRTDHKMEYTDTIYSTVGIDLGDRLTVDHVPTLFQVVYLELKIDEKGYVDINGELNLPLSLRWYDIFLNGRKLHKKNVTILSPTRMYIKGVKTTDLITIISRDRLTTDMFYINPNTKYKDMNNTLIDELIDDLLKDYIDANTTPIVSDEEFIGERGIFVKGYFERVDLYENLIKFTHLIANYPQLRNEDQLKEDLEDAIDENGVFDLKCNQCDNTIVIQRINCNKGVK